MPTPDDIAVEVWHAIIGGAQGIQYFDHNFCDGCSATYPLNASSLATGGNGYDAANVVIKNLNSRIKTLAPVINSVYVNGFETHTGQMNVMAKYKDGAIYIFAAPRSKSSQNITFTVKSGAVAQVLDENRTLTISNGTFTDTFANQDAIHIYKVIL